MSKRFTVQAIVHIEVEIDVIADDESDAMQMAEEMDFGEVKSLLSTPAFKASERVRWKSDEQFLYSS